MLRRWSVLLAVLAMMVGTVLTASSASASPRYIPSSTMNPGGPIHLMGSRLRGGTVESTNWSGYAGTTGTYTGVSGSWTQPAVTCTGGDTYAAFWAGLDGYSSDTVEQTGSLAECVGRTAEYFAWYEMYPSGLVEYSNTVKPGDNFTATVTYEGDNEFSLKLVDSTEDWTQDPTQSLSGAARSSAEVIAEAPCCTLFGGILPLADFGTVNYSGSTVTPTTTSEPLGDAGGLTEIVMVDNFGRDKDTVSSLSDGENFSCTWERSN